MPKPPWTGKHPPQELLIRYSAADVTDAELEAVAEHVATCAQCERVIDSSDEAKKLAEDCRQMRVVELRADAVGGGNMFPQLPGLTITAILGSGGMGIVYRATDDDFSPPRRVAVKVIGHKRMRGAAAVAEFQKEAGLSGNLRHNNIVQVHRTGVCQGKPYIVMVLIEGEDLSKITPRSRPIRDEVQMLVAVAGAVQHAHEMNVLHLDLKPANVLLDGKDEPYVTDFGMGQWASVKASARGGSPPYMAPEQARGEEVTEAADIFGLGAILYERLTGVPPNRGGSNSDALRTARVGAIISPRALRRAIPRDLEAICLKCLEKEPRERYSSAGDLAKDLQRFLKAYPVKARPLVWPHKLLRYAVARPVRSLAIIAILVLAGLTTYYRADSSTLGKAAADRKAKDQENEFLHRQEEAKSRYEEAMLLAEALWDVAPNDARSILEDENHCSADHRDERWYRLHRLSVRPVTWRNLPLRSATLPDPRFPRSGATVVTTKGGTYTFGVNRSVVAAGGHVAAVESYRDTDSHHFPDHCISLQYIDERGAIFGRSLREANGGLRLSGRDQLRVHGWSFSPSADRLAIIADMFETRPVAEIWDVKTGVKIHSLMLRSFRTLSAVRWLSDDLVVYAFEQQLPTMGKPECLVIGIDPNRSISLAGDLKMARPKEVFAHTKGKVSVLAISGLPNGQYFGSIEVDGEMDFQSEKRVMLRVRQARSGEVIYQQHVSEPATPVGFTAFPLRASFAFSNDEKRPAVATLRDLDRPATLSLVSLARN